MNEAHCAACVGRCLPADCRQSPLRRLGSMLDSPALLPVPPDSTRDTFDSLAPWLPVPVEPLADAVSFTPPVAVSLDVRLSLDRRIQWLSFAPLEPKLSLGSLPFLAESFSPGAELFLESPCSLWFSLLFCGWLWPPSWGCGEPTP